MEPESRQTHVLVAEDQLSLAIGKEGQNPLSRPPHRLENRHQRPEVRLSS